MKPIAADTIDHACNDICRVRDQVCGYDTSLLVPILWRIENCCLAETRVDVGHMNAGARQIGGQRYAESTQAELRRTVGGQSFGAEPSRQ